MMTDLNPGNQLTVKITDKLPGRQMLADWNGRAVVIKNAKNINIGDTVTVNIESVGRRIIYAIPA